jgi:sirohydrochlorin ferrochelatase
VIRHVVMWRVRGDKPADRKAARERVREAFEGLRGRIPGMTRLEIGLDQSAVDYACDVVLVTEFISQGALTAYAVHPEHQRVRAELGDLRTERYQVDYAVPIGEN